MGTSVIESDIHVRGNISATSISIPSNTVVDDDVNASADIAVTKLEHQYEKCYSQESDTTAAAEDHVVHVVYGTAGTVLAFSAGCVVANVSGATVTVDLHNNGSSILSAGIEIDDADAAYAVVDGTVNTATLAADDVLEVVVTVAAGGGTLGKGVFANLVLKEDAV